MLTARLLGFRYRNESREDFYADLASESDVAVVRAVRRFLFVYEEHTHETLCDFVCCEVAKDPDLAVFVACGPLREFAYDVSLNSITELLMHLDPNDCGTVVHDVIEQLSLEDTMNWPLMQRAVDLDPARYTRRTVTQQVVYEMKHSPPSPPLLKIIDTLKIDTSQEFRTGHGVDWVLSSVFTGMHAGTQSILERCLTHSIPLTVHSPVLVHVVDTLVTHEGEYATTLLRLLVRRAGTTLVVRLLRESRDFDATVRALHSRVPEVLELWPTRIGAVLGIEPPKEMDRVMASDGYTYHRDTILQCIVESGLSPMTDQPLDAFVVVPKMRDSA